uniref:Uncharacterized protein n=1 Tax=Providencia stuartii TaxID=588 RepID=A0AAI9DD61_PROST|nr:hypothetical protein [Providencia stuartii]
MKKIIRYSFLFFIFVFLGYILILLYPPQKIPATSYFYYHIFVNDLMKQAPFKKYISYYSFSSGERYLKEHVGIAYCNIPEGEIENVQIGLLNYLKSKYDIEVDSDGWNNEIQQSYNVKSNKNMKFTVTKGSNENLNCIFFSEKEFSYD